MKEWLVYAVVDVTLDFTNAMFFPGRSVVAAWAILLLMLYCNACLVPWFIQVAGERRPKR